MKIKIKNAYIFTVDSNFSIIENGCVCVENDKIVSVLNRDDTTFKADRVIDFEGDILLPGLINGHTHSAMTLFRGLADDLPLDKWLHESIFPLEKNLQSEHIYYGNCLAFLEYLRNGITTIADMYFMPEQLLESAKKFGINCIAIGGATDFGGQYKQEIETLKERFETLNNKCDNFEYRLGVHSEYLTTDELIDEIVSLSYKYHTPLYAHACETLKEVGECTVRRNDLSPIMYFHKTGFFDNGGALYHCVHIDKDDMAVMKQSNISCIANPASNLKLASGVAPIYTMLQNGINVGIGTDGAASNNCLDVFREMYLVSCLNKMTMHDAACISAEQVLKMATIDGAKALSLFDRGSVEKGKRADIIRIDTKKPHMQPRNNLAKHLVYSACGQDVAMTMIGGKILYENGRYHISENIDEIYKCCQKAVKYLREKL